MATFDELSKSQRDRFGHSAQGQLTVSLRQLVAIEVQLGFEGQGWIVGDISIFGENQKSFNQMQERTRSIGGTAPALSQLRDARTKSLRGFQIARQWPFFR